MSQVSYRLLYEARRLDKDFVPNVCPSEGSQLQHEFNVGLLGQEIKA